MAILRFAGILVLGGLAGFVLARASEAAPARTNRPPYTHFQITKLSPGHGTDGTYQDYRVERVWDRNSDATVGAPNQNIYGPGWVSVAIWAGDQWVTLIASPVP